MAGLEGHTTVGPVVSSEEPSGKLLAEERRAADRTQTPEGAEQQVSPGPGRTAAGDGNGYDIDFWTHGAPASKPGPTPDGHEKIDVILGG